MKKITSRKVQSEGLSAIDEPKSSGTGSGTTKTYGFVSGSSSGKSTTSSGTSPRKKTKSSGTAAGTAATGTTPILKKSSAVTSAMPAGNYGTPDRTRSALKFIAQTSGSNSEKTSSLSASDSRGPVADTAHQVAAGAGDAALSGVIGWGAGMEQTAGVMTGGEHSFGAGAEITDDTVRQTKEWIDSEQSVIDTYESEAAFLASYPNAYDEKGKVTVEAKRAYLESTGEITADMTDRRANRIARSFRFVTEDDYEAAQDNLRTAQAQLETYTTAASAMDDFSAQETAAADEHDAKSAELMDDATQDTNAAADVILTAVSAGTQMGLDIASAAGTGGGAMTPMLLRTFGEGAAEARSDGADRCGQIGRGFTRAMVEYVTERAFGGDVYGGTAGSGWLESAASHFCSSEGSRRLTSAIFHVAEKTGVTEGMEEVLSDIMNCAIDYGAGIGNGKLDSNTVWSDFLVGWALGLFGQGVSTAENGVTSAARALSGTNAGVAAETNTSGAKDTSYDRGALNIQDYQRMLRPTDADIARESGAETVPELLNSPQTASEARYEGLDPAYHERDSSAFARIYDRNAGSFAENLAVSDSPVTTGQIAAPVEGTFASDLFIDSPIGEWFDPVAFVQGHAFEDIMQYGRASDISRRDLVQSFLTGTADAVGALTGEDSSFSRYARSAAALYSESGAADFSQLMEIDRELSGLRDSLAAENFRGFTNSRASETSEIYAGRLYFALYLAQTQVVTELQAMEGRQVYNRTFDQMYDDTAPLDLSDTLTSAFTEGTDNAQASPSGRFAQRAEGTIAQREALGEQLSKQLSSLHAGSWAKFIDSLTVFTDAAASPQMHNFGMYLEYMTVETLSGNAELSDLYAFVDDIEYLRNLPSLRYDVLDSGDLSKDSGRRKDTFMWLLRQSENMVQSEIRQMEAAGASRGQAPAGYDSTFPMRLFYTEDPAVDPAMLEDVGGFVSDPVSARRNAALLQNLMADVNAMYSGRTPVSITGIENLVAQYKAIGRNDANAKLHKKAKNSIESLINAYRGAFPTEVRRDLAGDYLTDDEAAMLQDALNEPETPPPDPGEDPEGLAVDASDFDDVDAGTVREGYEQSHPRHETVYDVNFDKDGAPNDDGYQLGVRLTEFVDSLEAGTVPENADQILADMREEYDDISSQLTDSGKEYLDSYFEQAGLLLRRVPAAPNAAHEKFMPPAETRTAADRISPLPAPGASDTVTKAFLRPFAFDEPSFARRDDSDGLEDLDIRAFFGLPPKKQ